MKQKTKHLQTLLDEYSKMKRLYLSCYELLSTLRDELRASKFKLEDMTNFIYVMREISKLANDLRKETDGIGQMFENTACAIWVAKEDAAPIKASLATGTPDVKLAVKIPSQKHQPKDHAKLMTFFKIPTQVIDDRIVKLYWPGLCEFVSALAEEGKSLPPGVDPDNTYPTYKIRIRPWKDLDELTRDLEQAARKEADAAKEKAVVACDELLTTR